MATRKQIKQPNFGQRSIGRCIYKGAGKAYCTQIVNFFTRISILTFPKDYKQIGK